MDDLVTRLRAAGCVFAEDEAALLAELPEAEREAAAARRIAGEPLEHVLGWAEIAGVRIVVGPGVFVPRRRTELLIDHAARHLTRDGVLLDLCCGSGAIARVLAERCRPARVHASDVDPQAVALAAVNLAAVELAAVDLAAVELAAVDLAVNDRATPVAAPRDSATPASAPPTPTHPLAAGAATVGMATVSVATVSVADVVDGVPPELRGRVTVLTANVPYVPTADLDLLPRDVREHEPRHTHDGGADGLVLLRRVLAAAATWLAPGGVALAELAPHQVGEARRATFAVGLSPTIESDEESGTAVLLARRPRARRERIRRAAQDQAG